MSENCPFCQIVNGSAPAEIVYKDEQATAFRDRKPAAPVHLLIVPNRHIASLNEMDEADAPLLGHLLVVARKLAGQMGVSQSGYRVVINTGGEAGQTVHHLHVHLLGGKPLGALVRS